MGRYYSGDIDGKFWTAVQGSGAADRFGVEGTQPYYLEYTFYKDEHYDIIVEELANIKNNLGENFELIETFFSQVDSYNNERIQEFFATKGKVITDDDVENILSEYADYILGDKIRTHLETEELCQFTAEL